MKRSSTYRALAGLAAWAMAAGLAAGQGDRREGTAGRGGPDLNEYAARSISRVALLDIRSGMDPGPEEHQIVSLVLARALKFAPGDEGILRQGVEAAWRAGDEAATIELTKALLRLDPGDTVALLRLISARVGEKQTAEERLAAYDRFLGAEGQSIPAEVRSRLALDAALLLRERGDVEGFARRLAEATRLDSTNKEAAALASRFIAERTADPAARLEGLLNLLFADPLDPNIHLSVAGLLAGEWAFDQAKRFDDMAGRLYSSARGDITDAQYLEQLALVWHTKGPGEVVRMLNLDLGREKNRAAVLLRQAEAENAPSAHLPQPSEVTLAVPYERLRLLAATAIGDAATMASASAGLESVVRGEIERARGNSPGEQAEAARRRLLVTLASTRLWTGVDVEEARAVVEEMRAAGMLSDASEPGTAALSALAAVRESRFDEAIGAAGPAASAIDLAAVAMAQALEGKGDVGGAAEHYRRIVEDGPLTAAGAWSRSRLRALCGGCADPASAAQVDAIARAVPRTLDEMTTGPYTFMTLSAEARDQSPEPLERVSLRVTIKNISPFPLAVGSDRVINSRLLFAPAATVSVERLHGGLPEVVDIDRRLRIMPRETLSATVWPDLWSVGIDLETSCAYSTSMRWRIVQGFTISETGVYVPGAMCLGTDTPTLRRAALPEASLGPQALAERFATEEEPGLIRIVAAVRAALLGPRDSASAPPSPGAVEGVARAAARRYPSLGPAARAVLVAGLPHNRMARGMAVFDEAIRAEADADVLAVVLLTRPIDPDDELLVASASSSDPRIAELASLLRARLRTPAETYSRRRSLESAGGVSPQGEVR